MAGLITPRRISNQTLMFDPEEIRWEITDTTEPIVESTGTQHVTGAPVGVRAGIVSTDEGYTPPEVSRPPYWEFDYDIDSADGLKLTNINVRDTHSAGALEEVFEFIDFTDLEVEFTDGTKVSFDITAALFGTGSRFEIAENGNRINVSPNDPLYQRGLKLTLVHNVLSGTGGTCNVTLEMSVVFRGAANDFDPGGVPVALDLWPQLAFKWDNEGATKFVKRFRGSVRYLLHNKMSPLGEMTPLSANVAGYYTDSNESMSDGRAWALHGEVRAFFASFGGLPFGWRMVFDYLMASLSQEKEIVGVYGPADGNKFRQRASSLRRQNYDWPITAIFPTTITLAKRDRQGDYDNTHTHAKMANDRCGNVPVHAPFCAHSCIHLHWRWAPTAVNGAQGGRGWQFKGWSSTSTPVGTRRHTAVLTPRAYTTNGAPLIPPNQRLMHAVCTPTRTRYSDDHIFDPSSPGTLDPLRKLNWYSVDIIEPVANQKQVIFEQGMGWAYRYGLQQEMAPVNNWYEVDPITGLTTAMIDSLPDIPTPLQMAQFFDHVYEIFRYFPIIGTLPNCTEQLPEGTYIGGTGTSMEDL